MQLIQEVTHRVNLSVKDTQDSIINVLLIFGFFMKFEKAEIKLCTLENGETLNIVADVTRNGSSSGTILRISFPSFLLEVKDQVLQIRRIYRQMYAEEEKAAKRKAGITEESYLRYMRGRFHEHNYSRNLDNF